MIFFSITVITGMAGEISSVQATFAAIGACTTAQLATRFGMSVLVAMLVGARHRRRGRRVARAARAAARRHLLVARHLRVRAVLRERDGQVRLGRRRRAPRAGAAAARSGPIDFASDKSFLVLCLVVLVIVERRRDRGPRRHDGSRTRRARGSEVAAASIGISATRARIIVFALSAGIAAIGGGLLAMYEGRSTYNARLRRTSRASFWVVLVVTLGQRTVEGAIQAAIGFVVVPDRGPEPGVAVDRQPRAALVPHGSAAADARVHLLRPRRVHVRQASRGHARVQKRKSLDRVQTQIDRFKSAQGRGRRGCRRAESSPEPSAAPAGGGT